jgi:hypothetical protein
MDIFLDVVTDMSDIGDLPLGIKALRNFKLEKDIPVRPARFEKLVERLNDCAANLGKAVKCQRCRYLAECTAKFDAICGKVAMY